MANYTEEQFAEMQRRQGTNVSDIRTRQSMSVADLRKSGITGKGKKIRHVLGQMNKTEEAFSHFAENHLRAGLILGWWFESVTLLLGPNMRYTPDFMILEADQTITFVEVKPSYVQKESGERKVFARDGALEKLKVASTKYPFRFKLAVRQTGTAFEVKEIS